MAAAWPEARRLVVLVPAELLSETSLAARVYAAARERGLDVLFLGLAPQPEAEPALRRRLALLAACTRDDPIVKARYRLVIGGGWLSALEHTLQPGDLVVCHREQRLQRLWRATVLGDVLAARLRVPVVVLDGFSAPEARPLGEAARTVLFWLGALLVLAGFFWVQVDIQQQVQDWARTVLLIGSVAVEFLLLAAWHNWMR
jgi:hypothetical protein